MSKKSVPVSMQAKEAPIQIIKGSSIKVRDHVHYEHIVHRSGTGAHKSMKAYSRKAKHRREDVSFFCAFVQGYICA